MFPGGIYIVLHHVEVSIHICVGDVSPAGDAPVAVGVVSIHICAGNVSAIRLDVFESTSVSIHICAGNVSFRIRYRTMEHALISTHICAGGMFQYRPGTPAYGHKFQLIYVRGIFLATC